MHSGVSLGELQLRFHRMWLGGSAGLLGCWTMVAGLGGWPDLALGGAAAASVVSVMLARSTTGNVANLAVVFAIFHAVYGLSGPATVLLGGQLPDLFRAPPATALFLACYGAATVGLALAFGLAPRTWLRGGQPSATADTWLLPAAFGCGLVATSMELVNFVRAGGLPTVILGKAAYQSRVADLTLTLPSDQLALLAVALFALSIDREGGRSLWPRVVGFVALLSPLAILMAALGHRALLLNWTVAALLGVRLSAPPRRVAPRLVAALVAIYFVLGWLFANRALIGVSVATGDWGALFRESMRSERLAVAFNPAANEFGAAFGNFSEFVAAGPQPKDLGASYLRALVLPIPSFAYPGNKPQQVSYEFRERFFPGESFAGSIAGTAYSALLEAYANFGLLGVAAVYLVVGIALASFEWLRQRFRSRIVAAGYLMMVPAAVAFHRSAFADGAIGPLVVAAELGVAITVIGGAVRMYRAVAQNRAPGWGARGGR